MDAESVEAQAAKCSTALTSQSPGTTKAQPGRFDHWFLFFYEFFLTNNLHVFVWIHMCIRGPLLPSLSCIQVESWGYPSVNEAVSSFVWVLMPWLFAGVGGIKRGAGLSGLVSLLDSKKQKLTTLEKTKLDWNTFKSEEGIDEELEKHKKSKDGYLDKQAFLERADLRQFEIERAMRMSKRSNR